jgi:hypothetical protein
MQTIVLAVTTSHADEPAASLPEKQLRRITFNGKPLTDQQQRCLESLELSLGLRLPDRDYWCDPLELWSGLKSVAKSVISEIRRRIIGPPLDFCRARSA